MNIITYNIWDLPLWFVRERDKRLQKIGTFLAGAKYDIICLQESWSLKHRGMLSAFLRDSGYHDAVHQAGIRRKNGGLLTFSKFPISSVKFIPFGRISFSVSEFLGNKGVLETIIDTPSGKLRVCNLHLHYDPRGFFKSHSMRLRQLRKLFASLKKESSLPTIFAGDFNEDALFAKEKFKRLLVENGIILPTKSVVFPTYRVENLFVDTWINRTNGSKRYDYILFNEYILAENNEPLYLEPALSDHDPVVMKFELSPNLFL
ncbi:MAG TPA: endonuclease/exonuclease/phosphatase family protein [Candidatus Paceibacterota bacterium]|nr:endonuclease/exonuclease/phosphatase family protein [Candidatus Paceibacterota bacterium]